MRRRNRNVETQFRDDEADFEVPLSKFFRIVKRSSFDFDVIQVSRVADLPPIPKYEFNKSPGTAHPSNDSVPTFDNGSKQSTGINPASTGSLSKNAPCAATAAATGPKEMPPQTSDMPSEKDNNKSPPSKKAKELIKLESENRKSGCDCNLL